jgi:hypothetical protein
VAQQQAKRKRKRIFLAIMLVFPLLEIAPLRSGEQPGEQPAAPHPVSLPDDRASRGEKKREKWFFAFVLIRLAFLEILDLPSLTVGLLHTLPRHSLWHALLCSSPTVREGPMAFYLERTHKM